MHRFKIFAVFILLQTCFLSDCLAALRLSPLFSPHGVLQESASTAVWGWDQPGQNVEVTYGSARAVAVADKEGHWLARLDVLSAGPGATSLVVKGSSTVEISDIVPGEVWLASGQSNMEWILGKLPQFRANPPRESNPNVRMFTVRQDGALQKGEPGPLAGSWQVAQMPALGGFSAVGFFFAEAVAKSLSKPVGIINSSVGGSPIQAWMSSDGLMKHPETKLALELNLAASSAFPDRAEAYVRAVSARLTETGWAAEGPEAAPATPALNDPAWKPVSIPGAWPLEPGFNGGVIWLGREMTAPEQAFTVPMRLAVSGVRGGFETLYWNGKRLGSASLKDFAGEGALHEYQIPPGSIRPGSNTLLLRLVVPFGPLRIERPPTMSGFPKLDGGWSARVEADGGAASAPAEQTRVPAPEPLPSPKNAPGRLYSAMIAPLRFATIRGLLWYQGEANAGHHAIYGKVFPLLIHDWRKSFGEVPFLFCQLPAYYGKSEEPSGSKAKWAFFREAQAAALALPSTGMATLIDLGEATNIHPSDKEPVGKRLAAIALRDVYKRETVADGPVMRSAQREGDGIRIAFDHAGGGLVSAPVPLEHALSTSPLTRAPLVRNRPKSQLEGFAICDANRRWFWADATIEGETVIVRAPEVPEPVGVRYAWANNPTANLVNAAGLPARPFRTDDFPIDE